MEILVVVAMAGFWIAVIGVLVAAAIKILRK